MTRRPALPPGDAWDRAAYAYEGRWLDLNRPLLRRAFERLPDLPVEAAIHLAGGGPGFEVRLIARRFPGNPILVTDISHAMLRLARRRVHGHHRHLPAQLAVADMAAPPVQNIGAAFSFFVLHLVHRPLDAFHAQWESLVPDGLFVALYFPPTPIGEGGPLVALHRASRSLAPRGDQPWEREMLHFLEANGAREVVRETIPAQWRFSSPAEARTILEILPHLSSIRERAGDTFYNDLWDRFTADPGLVHDKGGWAGPVGAVLLTARKPAATTP